MLDVGIVSISNAASIGIPASSISVRYRSIPLPDWISLFRYRTASGIGILFIPVPVWLDAVYSPTFRHLKVLYEGGERYTIHVYTVGGGEEYTLHVCLLMVDRDTPCTPTLIMVYPACPYSKRGKGIHPACLLYIARGGEGYTLHIHTACGGKGYTLTSPLLAVKRDTSSRPHCWLWKGIQPHVHTAGGGKGYTLTSTLLVVERKQPYVHTAVNAGKS